MAGYIMTLDNEDSLKKCIETGTYSTKFKDLNSRTWKLHHEGTYADYLSMKENDNIYFFIKRKIYGIGRLINIKEDCKYLNYQNADEPIQPNKKEYLQKYPLLPYGTANNRCFCIFEPSPYFFLNGVDMDDVLNSNPKKFRMLRVLWKLSFIKIDDEENQALMDIILKRNEDEIFNGRKVFSYCTELHKELENKISRGHILTAKKLLSTVEKKGLIKHEMAIEAALCEILMNKEDTLFGKWDYVSHQVAASPFKAVDYMDKMDIFGYRYISGYKTKSRYLVIEIKKGAAEIDVIEQIMKYVDWIQGEYAFGDYSMIEAYVIAADFSDEVIEKRDRECIRNFTKGYRPTISCIWKYVKLVRYTYINKRLEFEVVE